MWGGDEAHEARRPVQRRDQNRVVEDRVASDRLVSARRVVGGGDRHVAALGGHVEQVVDLGAHRLAQLRRAELAELDEPGS
jgi:hypothetical protein